MKKYQIPETSNPPEEKEFNELVKKLKQCQKC